MAIHTYVRNEVPTVDRQDEEAWNDRHGCVSHDFSRIRVTISIAECLITRMAAGLGLSEEERKQLCGQVDDSFWVMRIIGGWWIPCNESTAVSCKCLGYPPLPNDDDGFSCGAHK